MHKSFLSDIAVYGLGDFIFKFIAFAVFPIYTHIFNVEEFGVIALVTTFAGLIATIMNSGTNNAVQRYYWDPATDHNSRITIVSTGLWLLVCSSFIVTITTVSVGYLFRHHFEQQFGFSVLFLLIALAANIPGQAIQFVQDVLRLHFSPVLFTVVAGLKNLTGLVVGLWLILYYKQGLYGFFMGNLIGLIIVIPVGCYFIRREAKLIFNATTCKQLFGFGYPFIFAGIAYWIFGSMDRWMIGILSDNLQVGLYSVAFKFATIVLFLNTAFGQAWSPFAIRLFAENESYRVIYSQTLSTYFLILSIVGWFISLFGPELLRLLTPSDYWAAAPIISFLATGICLQGTCQITAMGISLERKTKLISKATWFAAITNLALNALMIPLLGAIGAGIATMISYGLLTGFYLYWTQRLHPIPLEVKKLLFSILILLAAIFMSLVFNNMQWSFQLLAIKSVLSLILIIVILNFQIITPKHLKIFLLRSSV